MTRPGRSGHTVKKYECPVCGDEKRVDVNDYSRMASRAASRRSLASEIEIEHYMSEYALKEYALRVTNDVAELLAILADVSKWWVARDIENEKLVVIHYDRPTPVVRLLAPRTLGTFEHGIGLGTIKIETDEALMVKMDEAYARITVPMPMMREDVAYARQIANILTENLRESLAQRILENIHPKTDKQGVGTVP